MPQTSERKSDIQLDLLQSALDHINQGFSVFDSELNLVAWNNALLDMLDFPKKLGRRGTHISEFLRINALRGEYGEGDVEVLVAKRVARARRMLPHSFERERPNGQIIAIRGGPLPQGGFVTTYTDISRERRKQQRLEKTVEQRTHALRQSEDWLRLVTDNLPVLIAYMAPDESYRFANQPYAQWFSQTPASILGKSLQDIAEAPLYAQLQPQVREALEGKLVTYEYSRANAKGEQIEMRSTLVPDRTKDGRTLGCFILSMDVSEQKSSERRLMQAQRMDALGHLAGGLSHDFNNLLSIVIGNALAAKEKLATGSLPPTELASKHLQPILSAAERGADLTKRLLAFARAEPVSATPLDLEQALGSAAELISASLPTSISLTIKTPNAPCFAKADATLFTNALINLALNAKDAMPSGGSLEISLASGEQQHQLHLRDTGTGFDKQTQERAFDPFFTTKPFGKGSGLGLPMVYGFVQQCGGSIDITNHPEGGACVSLYLPASPPPQFRLKPNGKPVTEQLVLLVEDEEELAQLTAEQLASLGYQVLIAHSAAEARELLQDLPHLDLLLSDIVLTTQATEQQPETGIDLAYYCSKAHPETTLALLSGYRGTVKLPDQLDLPVLMKPFSQTQLQHFIAEQVN
ncbi:hybrid sensor histidine kinase/response regulator [Polycladidibacter hongkongensis]|uniref:hybrid sensor histidine kinase/response regulator n=1 Tax=Polycladidibacter hongkongensis TaxID=1647556 RepID=UPI0008372909|nr:PAS-domain containing protein [Pseudovibrio hongkongensis]